MSPKTFLKIGGSLLVVIGTLGIFGLFQKISTASFFHPPYWINYFHLILGSLILLSLYLKNKKLQVIFTFLAMVVATTIGLLGLIFGAYFAKKYNIPELADPSDHLAHLTVGLLAMWGWRNRDKKG